MSGQDGLGLQAPHLSEFISSLENCEWALTRAREALGSMVGGLRLQLQLQEPQQVAHSKKVDGDGMGVRVKIEHESVNVASAESSDGASVTALVGSGGTEPMPSARIQSLLEVERERSRETSVVALNSPLPLALAQTIPTVPLATTRRRRKKERTEQQRAVRREANKRKNERKRARMLAELEAAQASRLPPPGSDIIGTAANSAPLPFNRMSMPPPPPPSSNIGPWMNGFIGPVYPDGYMPAQMHPFTSATPSPLPALQTHNQQNFFFQSTPPRPSMASGMEANYELEEGEIQ